MAARYPESTPYDRGTLDAGDGNSVYWEVGGDPRGKPAVVLHGGPGSGCRPSWRRYFDPGAYRSVLVDQRGCGRSGPDAADPAVDLSTNTTDHLIADLELLRAHLGIETWLVLGVSWGTTLGLAYAERHPGSVSELVLFSVVTTTRREVEWVTRDMGRVFPEQWERFRDGVPEAERAGSLVDAYARLLADPEPAVRERAATDWCAWEDAHVGLTPGHQPNPRYDDPVFRMRFARLVTHYWRHAAWRGEDELQQGVRRLAGIPGVLVTGQLDVSAPPDVAWQLARDWPDCKLTIVDGVGHGAGMTELVVGALDRFAGRR